MVKNETITVRFKNKKLPIAIELLLAEKPLSFKILKNRRIIIKKSKKIKKAIKPENNCITGIVLDIQSGEAIPYASISIDGTTYGTISNFDGYFTLKDLPKSSQFLKINHLGYKLKSIEISEKIFCNNLKIKLEQNNYKLKAIVVKGEHTPVMRVNKESASRMSLNPRMAENLPNLGEVDLFRALQLLPGISGTSESTSGMVIRGGGADQNLVLFDGLTVYHVDHFFGILSAFNTNAIKDIQIYKGGFESRFGGRVSSVIEISGKSGSFNNIRSSLNINMLNANLLLEIPLFKNKGSLLLAGRRSYIDFLPTFLYSKLFDNINSQNGEPSEFNRFDKPNFYFYDTNLKFTVKTSDNELIAFSFFNSKDHLDNVFDTITVYDYVTYTEKYEDKSNWGNQGGSAKWAKKWSKSFYTNLNLASSRYFTKYENKQSLKQEFEYDTPIVDSYFFSQDNVISDYSLKFDSEWVMSNQHSFKSGFLLTANQVSFRDIYSTEIVMYEANDRNQTLAFYLQDSYQPFKNMLLTIGLRANHYNLTNKFYYEPRFSFSYKLKSIHLKGAVGQYYQFVNRIISDDVLNSSPDFWLLSGIEDVPVVSSKHYIAGASYENEQFLFDVEFYYKKLGGLMEYIYRYDRSEIQKEDASSGETINNSPFFYYGEGIAKGIDVLFHKKVGQFTGWASYSLAYVDYKFPDINKGKKFSAVFDQRNEFKLVGSFRYRKWNFSLNWIFATGRPYTAPIGNYIIDFPDGTSQTYVQLTEKNALRLPAYHRLDVSANWNFSWKKIKGKVGISVFNAYNQENIKYRKYYSKLIDDDGFLLKEPIFVPLDIKMLGFTPNLFLILKF